MSKGDYRADVDGLRGIAILLVMLFHAHVPGFAGGFVCVDVFFVISGFLITRIVRGGLGDGSFRFLEFYAARARRLFPNLLLVLLTTFLIGFFVLPPQEFAEVGKHTIAAILFGSNFTFWSESGYFDKSAELKPLLMTWSLAVEEQVYLLWPPLLALCHRLRLRLAPLAIGLAAFSLAAAVAIAPPTSARRSTSCRRAWARSFREPSSR